MGYSLIDAVIKGLTNIKDVIALFTPEVIVVLSIAIESI